MFDDLVRNLIDNRECLILIVVIGVTSGGKIIKLRLLAQPDNKMSILRF